MQARFGLLFAIVIAPTGHESRQTPHPMHVFSIIFGVKEKPFLKKGTKSFCHHGSLPTPIPS